MREQAFKSNARARSEDWRDMILQIYARGQSKYIFQRSLKFPDY